MSEMGDDITLPADYSGPYDWMVTQGEGLLPASSDPAFDWSKFVSTIGSTFATTYNSVNQQPGGSYPPPTNSYGATNPSVPAAGGMSSLFEPPNLYFVLGGAALLVVMLMKKGGD